MVRMTMKMKTGFPMASRKRGNRKLASLIGLCVLSVVSLFLVDEITQGTKRRLICSPSGRKISHEELEGDETRYLSRMNRIIDRVLDIVEDGPCTSNYPQNVNEPIADAARIDAMLKEPTFDITSNAFIDDTGTKGDEITKLDVAERSLISSFKPEVYDPAIAEERKTAKDRESIAYIIPLVGCPGVNYIPSVDATSEPQLTSDLYEASAIVKCAVCETTDAAANARRLGETRKLSELGDRLSAAEMNYTMHAIVHPESAECPIEGTRGDTFDRVKLLQSLNYYVEILGQPITDEGLQEVGHYHLNNNIQNDVGIRDSVKLWAWTMTDHPIVVLMSYNTILNQPIDQEIDFLLASDTMKGLYIHTKPDPDNGGSGVDTGFMIIKPDQAEFENIVNQYLNTPYDPSTGWNGQGFNNFKGGLGISGFLAYYFANDPGYLSLDRCTYAHTADADCLGTVPFENRKASSMLKDICGDPRECPYANPNWDTGKTEACEAMHRTYFNYRYEFEQKFLVNKKAKQERIGLFRQNSFLGYCTGPGKAHFLSLSGAVVPKPEWETICPPDKCPDGSYMKPDCTCTDPLTPCEACPENTICQTYPSLMCIDCGCAFCDRGGTECCEFDGIDNCRASLSSGKSNQEECDKQSNFFPAFHQTIGNTNNICGDFIGLSRNNVPNGCGCKPDAYHPCTYNHEWGTRESKCFICTAADLAEGTKTCLACKECLQGCIDSGCIGVSVTTEDFMNCMQGMSDSACRAQCHSKCMKN